LSDLVEVREIGGSKLNFYKNFVVEVAKVTSTFYQKQEFG